jgi:phosphatidylglycerol---prolipoprotein diacylglyceryl transferase
MEQFFYWWNHLPLRIDPVLWEGGPFQLRYYSLMYLTSIMVFYMMTRLRLKSSRGLMTKDQLDLFMTYGIVGVVLGARLGYVVFYDPLYFLSNPVLIVWPYQVIDGQGYFGISGLSYHGGLLGALFATMLFCKRYHKPFLEFGDFIIPAVPLGYMFGRIGNFLNGELYGRVTSSPWGMYFQRADPFALRHPSQLYEAFFEGFVLFIVLWVLSRKALPSGLLIALYVIGYAVARFFIEYFREPDEHLGVLLWELSMGQILSLLMILGGVLMIVKIWRNAGRKRCQHG